MNRGVKKAVTVFLIAVCLFSVYMFLRQQQDNSRGSEAYARALEVATGQAVTPVQPIRAEAAQLPETTALQEPGWIPAPLEEADPYVQMLLDIDLAALQAKNPDVLGWIFLPDTMIHYPVLQGQDNTYYLEHAWDGTANSVGSIFMETQNTSDFGDFNTILYGHNMNNGAMFAELHEYSSRRYWETHPYVYLRNAEGVFRYEIFAAYKAKIDSSAYGLSFRQLITRANFLKDAADGSVIDTGVTPSVTDRILTLSTCTGTGYSSRWIVQARLEMIPNGA